MRKERFVSGNDRVLEWRDFGKMARTLHEIKASPRHNSVELEELVTREKEFPETVEVATRSVFHNVSPFEICS